MMGPKAENDSYELGFVPNDKYMRDSGLVGFNLLALFRKTIKTESKAVVKSAFL